MIKEGEGQGQPSAVLRWSHAHGSGAYDVARAIAKTDNGVVVAGMLGPSATVGCGTRYGAGYASFVAAYASDGTCTWATYFESDEDASPAAISIDATGAVYVAGTFSGSLTFGNTTLTSAGGFDAFAAKLGSDGSIVWSQRFGGTSDEYVYSATFAGNRYAIGGAFYDTIQLSSFQKTSAGDADAFIAELGSNGAPLALRSFGADGWDSVDALGGTASGDLVAGGTFDSTVDFGGGPIVSAGGQDGYVAIFSSAAAPTHFRRIGGVGSDAIHGVAVDGSGNIYVTGYFQGSVDVGRGSAESANGAYASFIATYDGSFAFVRATTLDGPGANSTVISSSIAVNAAGTVAVGGYFRGAASFATASGTSDAFVAVLQSDGAFRWTKRLGNTGATEAYAIGFAANGDIVAGGAYDGSVTLDSEKTAAGETDSMFFALTP